MREPAWRVFSAEFNASKHYIKATEPKKPSYVLTPLGAKISRIFIVGVLTRVDLITDEMVKARIADQTGVFFVIAGKYNPEARELLESFRPPEFVAVVGKVNAYSPSEDTMYVSVVPEKVKRVDEALRDYWVFDTAKKLKVRIDAMQEALKMDNPSPKNLEALGFSRRISEGVVDAIKYYDKINVERYMDMLREALKYLVPEYKEMGYELPGVEEEEPEEEKTEEKYEELIFKIIEELDEGDGVSYDDIIRESGLPEEKVEEIVLSLQESGRVYEPKLGRFRRT
jgi:RPA family protein/predicted transcriptional regulator